MRAASLCERRTLELCYDGPIPPHALGDLRCCPQHPFIVVGLSDRELELWVRLVRSNVKAEQHRLAERRARMLQIRSVITCPAADKSHALDLAQSEARWSLNQCKAARTEGHSLITEANRRARATRTLSHHMRTLKAMADLF